MNVIKSWLKKVLRRDIIDEFIVDYFTNRRGQILVWIDENGQAWQLKITKSK